jgi:hypothetical protein
MLTSNVIEMKRGSAHGGKPVPLAAGVGPRPRSS